MVVRQICPTRLPATILHFSATGGIVTHRFGKITFLNQKHHRQFTHLLFKHLPSPFSTLAIRYDNKIEHIMASADTVTAANVPSDPGHSSTSIVPKSSLQPSGEPDVALSLLD